MARMNQATKRPQRPGIKINTPVNEADLEQGRQKIIETYQIHGFNDVTVQYRVDPIEESRGTARIVVHG